MYALRRVVEHTHGDTSGINLHSLYCPAGGDSGCERKLGCIEVYEKITMSLVLTLFITTVNIVNISLWCYSVVSIKKVVHWGGATV